MKTYRVFEYLGGKKGIECLLCGRISYNINDTQEKYCAHCHKFHDDEVRSREANPNYQHALKFLIAGLQNTPAEEVREVLQSLIFEIKDVAEKAATGSDEETWFSKLFEEL